MARILLMAGAAVVVVALLGYALFGRDGDGGDATTAPQTPSESTPSAGASTTVAERIVPSFDVVRISRGGTGVVAGRSAPGARVQ